MGSNGATEVMTSHSKDPRQQVVSFSWKLNNKPEVQVF